MFIYIVAGIFSFTGLVGLSITLGGLWFKGKQFRLPVLLFCLFLFIAGSIMGWLWWKKNEIESKKEFLASLIESQMKLALIENPAVIDKELEGINADPLRKKEAKLYWMKAFQDTSISVDLRLQYLQTSLDILETGSAHFLRGTILTEMQPPNLADAISDYRFCIKHRFMIPESHNNLGNALETQGNFEGAEKELREAIRLNPSFAEAHMNLGNMFDNQRKYEEAEKELHEAIRLKPYYAEAHYNLGITLENQGKVREAEEEYREALRLKPDFAEGYNNLGNTLFKKGKFQEASKMYYEALRLKPDFVEVYNNLGVVLWKLGKPVEAEAAIREAIRLKSNYADAYDNLGVVLWKQGKIDEAIDAYRETIKYRPNDARALKNIVIFLDRQGRVEEAREYREKAEKAGVKIGASRSRTEGWPQ